MEAQRENLVGAVVLLAGQSRRVPNANKLLLQLPSGQTLAEHCIQRLLDAGVALIVGVTGYDAVNVRTHLEHLPIDFVHNSNHLDGIGTSIACAFHPKVVDPSWSGALVILADMPLVSGSVLQALTEAHSQHPDSIVVPVFLGRRGNPVLFPKSLFDELAQCSGDIGGKPILQQHPDKVVMVDVSDSGVFVDVDSIQDLQTVHHILDGS
jgi:molybdenum cofactor cytidylyltransferase